MPGNRTARMWSLPTRDRVREMNDEELAKFMLSSNGAAYCKNNDRDSTCYLKGRDGMTACELCALDWLREEAE